MIPYGRQDVTEEDLIAVVEALQSDFLTQGELTSRFEQAVAKRVGALHGVAMNSATSALHVACVAVGLGPGDVLWTSPNSFVASANCGIYCGADVDFVDIDPVTLNMSVSALERKLKDARETGRRLPRVVVPVHFSGQPCDMREIGELARDYGFRVIEDASHAIGAAYAGKPVGACEHSDITVFSFHPVKIVTTAEGGVAVTNDPDLAARMARLRSHGITRDPTEMTHVPDGAWYYQQIELGWNYRMTELQAALGLSQLRRLDHYLTRRREIANRYDLALADMRLTLPVREPTNRSALHLYVVKLDDPLRHGEVFNRLRADGIGVNLHYIPIHLQPFYRKRGFVEGDFPNAEEYYSRAISLPMFPALTKVQQDKVVTAVRRAVAD